MDLGASTYNGWDGDFSAVGAKWVVERFARNTQVQFDRIIAFEYTIRNPEDVFYHLPRHLWGRYTYYNLPVSANPSDQTHPWSVLLSVASPRDYVIVKLDIDTPTIERELIRQLLTNTTISKVVDELFYENHVNTASMHYYWGLESDELQLRHSYEMFTKLRRMGIRAHSWP